LYVATIVGCTINGEKRRSILCIRRRFV